MNYGIRKIRVIGTVAHAMTESVHSFTAPKPIKGLPGFPLMPPFFSICRRAGHVAIERSFSRQSSPFSCSICIILLDDAIAIDCFGSRANHENPFRFDGALVSERCRGNCSVQSPFAQRSTRRWNFRER